MYRVSNEFNTAAEATTRNILVKADFGDGTKVTGDDIISMNVVEAVSTSDGLSMGKTISSKLTMSTKVPSAMPVLEGEYIMPEISFVGNTDTATTGDVLDGVLASSTSNAYGWSSGVVVPTELPELNSIGVLLLAPGLEYCPLGKFYITEATSRNDFQTAFDIVAYDGFCKTESLYEPTISMPNSAQAIMKDIATQCGISLSPGIVYPSEKIDLYEWTCRKYIGYIAGLAGKNARFDRDGNLTFVWYSDSSYGVGQSIQFMSGFKRLTSADFTMNSITSGSSDNVLVSGSGIGISFENPLMTQDALDKIFSAVGTLSYTPANLKWRGNPAIEAGDIIVAEDKNKAYHTIYVMEQTLKISGGMYSEIKCYGDSEAAINFSTSPQSKKLQQVYTKLQSAVDAATKLLNGSNGGIFEITDENGDGVNDGWIIHSADKQRFIKANVNGIGITTDGGATYQQAMTSEGINADVITVGQMNAERISVGDAALGDVFSVEADDEGHPVVTIGSSNNDIKQKQTNDSISFINGSNDTVAKFSITGAEWEDMQEMKYCGFVWSKSSVTGNVRFTKAGVS